ncbi:MAG TPA: hypothetical protein VEF89_30120 [Solirubrobacteraceae bacterium]|nr:hypothetical protein [Solirubrobacteraceae bacterium]
MARFEEIVRRVEHRLEELLEESARLGAALEALRGDHAPGSRGVRADRTTEAAVNTVSRDRLVKPGRTSAVSLVEPESVGGDDVIGDSAVERAVRQLRQELAAGLRNG